MCTQVNFDDSDDSDTAMEHDCSPTMHAVDIENNNNLYKYDSCSAEMDCEATFPTQEEEEAAEESYEEGDWEQEPFDP